MSASVLDSDRFTIFDNNVFVIANPNDSGNGHVIRSGKLRTIPLGFLDCFVIHVLPFLPVMPIAQRGC